MKQRILHLTLKKEPFDVMVTGEKRDEFRAPTKWIMSRLVDKNGKPKKYDVIKFTNGYGKTKPHFICEYKGFDEMIGPLPGLTYSNGFVLPPQPAGTIMIHCGKIGITRNIKKLPKCPVCKSGYIEKKLRYNECDNCGTLS